MFGLMTPLLVLLLIHWNPDFSDALFFLNLSITQAKISFPALSHTLLVVLCLISHTNFQILLKVFKKIKNSIVISKANTKDSKVKQLKCSKFYYQ